MHRQHSKFDAVVIGASAGGVEALLTLLEDLPESFPAAVLIVLHLPADCRSVLASVLSNRCSLPIKEAQDKEDIVPGRGYVAPPDYHLLVEPDRSLSLSQDEAVHFSRPSIDLLFESAAWVYRERLLGIVLTGANQDGSAGLKAISEHGGTTWVQEPADALATIMPQAAIDAAAPDSVLTLEAMKQKLKRLDRAER
ncbi:chemotaxis protein CheB [Noviherbaspirillum galbum]|uniref:protein-glutamate methylesterase n=1 Tax=Noviherbaspirillum galbum TaxID=2709383 RepID=A0A6B3SUN3_9BURK|nr:chemotaxis protein CheB [Noviherbaspirillum galbum]NEX62596.1 chemotaxis protein CheB [Noviherbaspirillum galbum]